MDCNIKVRFRALYVDCNIRVHFRAFYVDCNIKLFASTTPADEVHFRALYVDCNIKLSASTTPADEVHFRAFYVDCNNKLFASTTPAEFYMFSEAYSSPKLFTMCFFTSELLYFVCVTSGTLAVAYEVHHHLTYHQGAHVHLLSFDFEICWKDNIQIFALSATNLKITQYRHTISVRSIKYAPMCLSRTYTP